MQHVKRILATLLALCFGAAIAVAHGVKTRTIEVVHPWTFGASAGDDINVCMKIKNIGRRDDRLVRAQTPLATSVSLVEPVPAAPQGSRTVQAIGVKAGQHAELALSGQSILLRGFKKPLSPYDTFTLSLVFEKAGRIDVEVLVEEGSVAEQSKK
ncbi:MAG: copper chaperone PCu(A)C [Hyphomicrobiaceae bacterium]|nr:copper chaperone PCu(A)C [Hyphomicrobiaceae bacterium]